MTGEIPVTEARDRFRKIIEGASSEPVLPAKRGKRIGFPTFDVASDANLVTLERVNAHRDAD